MQDADQSVENWAQELLGPKVLTKRLGGGANNYVYRCSTSGSSLIVKKYPPQNSGASSVRRDSEVAFLQHAAQYAPEFVPRLLGSHPYLEMIALSDLSGDPFSTTRPVTDQDVFNAICFYQKLNADFKATENYPMKAREGFLSISEHMRNVNERLARLTVEHLPAALTRDAQKALARLCHDRDQVFHDVTQEISAGLVSNSVSCDELQISPGDFGFHNAIRNQSKTFFFDFEYAGLDDPAKTLADFILQPRIPIRNVNLNELKNLFAIKISKQHLASRTKVLGRVLAVKWAAIILSPLDPERFVDFRNHFSDVTKELRHRFTLSTAVDCNW